MKKQLEENDSLIIYEYTDIHNIKCHILLKMCTTWLYQTLHKKQTNRLSSTFYIVFNGR